METLYYNPGSEIELTCIIRNRSHWSSKTLWLKDNYPLDLYHRSTVRYVPQFRQNSSKFAILLIFEYNNYILKMYGVLLKSIFSEIRDMSSSSFWSQKKLTLVHFIKHTPLFSQESFIERIWCLSIYVETIRVRKVYLVKMQCTLGILWEQ